MMNIVFVTHIFAKKMVPALMAILPMRALKNLIMWPIDSIVFFGIAKALEQIGLFRTFRKPELVKNA